MQKICAMKKAQVYVSVKVVIGLILLMVFIFIGVYLMGWLGKFKLF